MLYIWYLHYTFDTSAVFFFSYALSQKILQANIEKIYNRFIHLNNLPEDGLQCVLCVGLQFGKVDHHVFLSNKNKVTKSLLFLFVCSIKNIKLNPLLLWSATFNSASELKHL